MSMNGQRQKTAAFMKKTPQRLAVSSSNENGLHIYYGDNWRPLISSPRTIALPNSILTTQMPGARSSSLSSSSTRIITSTPNFSRPRNTTSTNTHQSTHLPKLPNVLQRHRPAGAQTSTTTRRSKISAYTPSPVVRVWDSSRADPEHGSGLQIRRLGGGMGIAVHGHYTDRPHAGQQVRHDAFLAHLVEGRMEETMHVLAAQVDEAVRRWGLTELQTDICYRDDQTLDQDSGMIWNSQMIGHERRLNDRFICRAEELWGCTPRLHPYHVRGDRIGMCVSSGGAKGSLGRVVSVTNI